MSLPAHQNKPLPWGRGLRGLTGGCLRPGGLELTRRLLGNTLAPGAQVLELGCGPGRSLQYMRRELGLRAVGLDLSHSMLLEARSRSQAPAIRADAACLPVRRASVDAVLCECMLSLVLRLEDALAEIARVLRPGGMLFCSDLYARGQAGEAPPVLDRCCIDGILRREEWAELLSRRGFIQESWKDHTPALKHLAAELIFAHGSLEEFWRALLPAGRACEAMARSKAARPGYFCLTARKG